nr:hypothetical protein [Tanacetum cinerariifolium]
EELEKLKRQEKEANDAVRKEATHEYQDANINSTNLLNVVNAQISTVGPLKALNDDEPLYPDDPLMPHLKDIYASLIYQMDVKSVFLYGTIDKEVYVTKPPRFVDIKFPNKKSWCDEFKELMKNRFQMSSMGGLTFFLGLQTLVATSTTEAEYVAAAHCCRQVLWIQN